MSLVKKLKNKVFTNSIWMMSEKLISIFGLIFVTSFVAKYIGPENFGKLTFASSIFAIIQTIAMLGSENIIFQKTAKDRRLGEYIIDSTKIIRDFVYVKDLIEVGLFLMNEQPKSGIYNLGSGTARTFLDLAKNTFYALDKTPQIDFIDTPADIRDKYQYYTQADMTKLKKAGYSKKFHTLEEGVEDYVKNYLIGTNYY